MKRSAAQYAVLGPLLDEAVELDDAARAQWIAALPEALASYRPALGRILQIDDAASLLRLNALELRLRRCSHDVHVLVTSEFERRRR